MIFPEDKAYRGKVTVNSRNLKYISKVKHYVPEEFQAFYGEIMQFPTSDAVISDQNID